MSEIVERVAKAIDAVLGDDHESLSMEMGVGSVLSNTMRVEAMEKAARAAIEVMLEETRSLIDPGGDVAFHALADALK